MFYLSKRQVINHRCLVKLRVATQRFLITCVFQNAKSYGFLLCPVWGKIMLMFKNITKIGISAHSLSKKGKTTILRGDYLGQVVIIWAKFVAT